MVRSRIIPAAAILVLAAGGCGRDATGPSPATVATALSVGSRHVCLIDEARTVCWGEGKSGQLGIGTTPADSTPVVVPGAPAFTFLSAGALHTCALDGSGAAWCWGSNVYGELGSAAPGETCGGLACRTTPVPVSGGLAFRALAAGTSFTCGLTTEGPIYCWGRNDTGQLGRRNDSTCNGLRCAPLPALAADGRTFTALSAGLSHVCALDLAGGTWCWGYYGLKVTGERANPEFLPEARTFPDAPHFVRISAGGYHTCALTASGAAWCWGIDALGAGTTLESDHPVAVQGNHRCRSFRGALRPAEWTERARRGAGGPTASGKSGPRR